MNKLNCVIAKDENQIAQLLDSGFFRIISGGTSILRESNPFTGNFAKHYDGFIDISSCKDLIYIYLDGTIIKIGSATNFSTILNSTVIKTHVPMLLYACKNIGSIQTRNRATIGGHVVSEFNGDALTALYALEAVVKIKAISGITRTAPISDIAMNSNEFITEIAIPLQSGDGSFAKFPFSTHDRINIAYIKKHNSMFMGGIDKKPIKITESFTPENIQDPYRIHIAKELIKEMKTV